MHAGDIIGNDRGQLALKKQIDSICDRFEAAWTEKRRPRIEDYLKEIPPASRIELFRELLISELAFRGAVDSETACQDYLGRFPEHRQCVLEAFADAPTHRLSDDSVRTGGRTELVEKVRQRLRPADQTSMSASKAAAGQTAGRPQVQPPLEVEPLSERLWDLLIRRAGVADRIDLPPTDIPENVERLAKTAQQLLAAFPSLRQEILRDLLFGLTVSQAAQNQHATERTVVATAETAILALA
jgi:hypothetical protein